MSQFTDLFPYARVSLPFNVEWIDYSCCESLLSALGRRTRKSVPTKMCSQYARKNYAIMEIHQKEFMVFKQNKRLELLDLVVILDD